LRGRGIGKALFFGDTVFGFSRFIAIAARSTISLPLS